MEPSWTSGQGKIALCEDGAVVEAPPTGMFELQPMRSGRRRLRILAPKNGDDLFRALAVILAGPLYVLYVLHTPRGEGALGRYQSEALSGKTVDAFLARYGAYFASDARHDLWIYSPSSAQTLVWDRHNHIFVEGEPLQPFLDQLAAFGVQHAAVPELGEHIHYYRPEFDADAADVLSEFDWHRTPLRPEDEQ